MNQKIKEIEERFDDLLTNPKISIAIWALGGDDKRRLAGFIKKELQNLRSETLKEIESQINNNFQQMINLYKGKLPFIIFHGKADDREKLAYYHQGILNTLEIIQREQILTNLEKLKNEI